jgi:hypothetical protein
MKTGEYFIDSMEGAIHFTEFLKGYSSSFIRYKYPNLKSTMTYIRNHFKKFDIVIPNPPKEWKKEELISVINDFVVDNDRIPTNREFNDSKSIYPSVNPFIRVFKTWNLAIESAGYDPNTNLYGISVQADDGNNCRSLLEFEFINKFLCNKVSYIYEPRYPNPYKLLYDFYLTDLNVYIEIAGGTSKSYLDNLERKININKVIGKNLLVVYDKDIKNFNSIEGLIDGSKTYYRGDT